MEIKKSQFDQRPLLVEYEGAVVRINFDIEETTAVVNPMSGGDNEEQQTRTVYLAHVVRVAHPLSVESIKEAVMAMGFDEFKAEAVAAEALMTMAIEGQHVGDELELAKRLVIARINAYDKSDAVNQFTFNNIPMWLSRELRQTLLTRFDAEKTAKRDQSTIRYGEGADEVVTLTPTQGIALVKQLECYAADCYEQTNNHKAAVVALETVADVLAYDYTAGYPSHPEF